MKIYQLRATGEGAVFDSEQRCYSKRLFASKARAEAHIPKFRKSCTTEASCLDLSCLKDNKMLKFHVLELELGFWEALRGCFGL